MNKYNSMVNGIHNYYQIATHVNADFTKLGYHIQKVLNNRLTGITKKGKYEGKHNGILTYMDSSMVRYYRKYPILPIGYVKHKNPLNIKRSVNKYTEQGRLEIHKKLTVIPEWKLEWLRNNPVMNKRATIEFADNRISKYIAQLGRCSVTGEELELDTMQCHHIIPYHVKQDDSYNNLTIVSYEIHKLIHATNPKTIEKFQKALSLTKEQLNKLNKLREKAGNDTI